MSTIFVRLTSVSTVVRDSSGAGGQLSERMQSGIQKLLHFSYFLIIFDELAP